MGRPLDQHIDNEELKALVPSPGDEWQGISPDAIREAERHVSSCQDCSTKVSKYRQVVDQISNLGSKRIPQGDDCPDDDDVDWHEVAAGRWPELKARQLILHAALCDHCGPLLRAAASLNNCPSSLSERPSPQLTTELQPNSIEPEWSPSSWWQVMRWLVPAAALLVIAGVLGAIRLSSRVPLSGSKFAEIAVSTHQQRARGALALDIRSESQQELNDWFKNRLPFVLALPSSAALPGAQRPFMLQGARLVQISGKTAALIGYQMQTGPVSLIVAPDALAVASGGVEVSFKKVSFHYSTVEGYKVVTWSVHGLTYALVSQEGNSTQQSCMVCHSAMGDRDLSQTPTPLARNPNEPVWQ